MKTILISAILMAFLTTFANDNESDIHPRCPFKYYKNVDKKSLCLAYDNEMGECQGESQLDCSNEAFDKTLQKFSVKKQEIDFEEVSDSLEEEKGINNLQLKECKFAESDKRIVCRDGRVYILQTTSINDSSRGIIKKIEKDREAHSVRDSKAMTR